MTGVVATVSKTFLLTALEPTRLTGRPCLQPPFDVGGNGIGDVSEFGMFLEHRDHHGAHRHDALPLIPRLIQRLPDQNAGQATSAIRRIDFGVIENPLGTRSTRLSN